MQKAPQPLSVQDRFPPTILGTRGDMKEVYILSGLVGFLAVVVAASGTTPRQTRQPIPTAQRRR